MSISVPPLALQQPVEVPPVPIRFLGGLALVALAFLPTWVTFPSTWWQTGGHAFFVALFCGWLLWRDRALLRPTGHGVGVASLFIAALSVLWLMGYVLNVRLVHQAVVPAVLLLWLLATAGMSAFRVALPTVAAFYLAVPLWGALVRPLQSMTVFTNSLMLKLTGIEAVIEGDYITIPAGVFWVARGCAGLNFFEIGVFVATVYALLFLRSWQGRAASIALGALLAVVSNWIRVFGLVVIGHLTEMQSSLVSDHELYGWIIFSMSLAVFFFLARRVDALDARFASADAAREPTSQSDDNRRTVTSAPRARAVSWRTLVAPSGAAMLGPLLLLGSQGRPPSGEPSDATPGIAPTAEWTLQSQSAEPWQDRVRGDSSSAPTTWKPAYRGADEHRIVLYANDSVAVRVDRVLYRSQSQGKELINSENRLAPDSLTANGGIAGPVDETGRMVNVTAVRTASGVRLIWWWYNVANVNTHFGTEAKLLELAAFAARSPASELIAVSTPCLTDDCALAPATLYRFVSGRELPPESARQSP